MNEPDLIARAKAFVKAVGSATSAGAIEAFYDPDIVQEEFPNRLLPQGVVRDLAALQEACERGRKLMSTQSYDVVNAIRTGDSVALEVIWTGTLAVALGDLKPGYQMRARFAQFFEFRNGRIWRQRNYDCFDPW
jgi:ketosteroid isomerase-like protein